MTVLQANAIKVLGDCSTVEAEYWLHVSRQAELPLAAGAAKLADVDQLNDLANEYANNPSTARLADYIAEKLLLNPKLINEIRVLAGVSDKRLYLDLSYLFSRILDPTNPKLTLCGEAPHLLTKHDTAFFKNKLSHASSLISKMSANTIAEYLVEKGIEKMLRLYADMAPADRNTLVANLIMPKELQQNETKRRGHGAEAAVAKLLSDMGIAFLPANKILSPMGKDVNVDATTFKAQKRVANKTISFDLIVCSGSKVRGCLQGLVQSSDPGQFGVNKSDETMKIRKLVDAYNLVHKNEPIQFWGLIDGVGYCENKAGTLNKMLEHFSHFVQVKSLYKIGLGMHLAGLCVVKGIYFDPDFYSDTTKKQMIERYVPDGVMVFSKLTAAGVLSRVDAGAAILFM